MVRGRFPFNQSMKRSFTGSGGRKGRGHGRCRFSTLMGDSIRFYRSLSCFMYVVRLFVSGFCQHCLVVLCDCLTFVDIIFAVGRWWTASGWSQPVTASTTAPTSIPSASAQITSCGMTQRRKHLTSRRSSASQLVCYGAVY